RCASRIKPENPVFLLVLSPMAMTVDDHLNVIEFLSDSRLDGHRGSTFSRMIDADPKPFSVNGIDLGQFVSDLGSIDVSTHYSESSNPAKVVYKLSTRKIASMDNQVRCR